MWKAKHSPLHCIYGFAYGFPSQWLQQIWFKSNPYSDRLGRYRLEQLYPRANGILCGTWTIVICVLKHSVAWNNSFRRIFSASGEKTLNHYNATYYQCHTCYISTNYCYEKNRIALITIFHSRYLVACIRLLSLWVVPSRPENKCRSPHICIPVTDRPIHNTRFMGLRWQLKLVYR